jgi:thermitase
VRKPAAFFGLIVLAAAAVAAALFAHRAGAAVAPNDPRYPEQWALTKIRAHEAWGVTQGSTAVKVALVDSGIGYGVTIMDLQGQVGTGFNTFTGGTAVPDDLGTYGSGTSNAGIIGARTNNSLDVAGANWNVTILPVKVCDWTGACPAARIAQGVDWAVSQNAQIIQITPALVSSTPELDAAVARAVAAGRLVVSAVASPGTGIGYPGLLPGVITVGATNSGDGVTTWSAGGAQLDIVAPGESVMALVSGGCCLARTSGGAAASHVTGALALLLSAGVPPSQAAGHLYTSAQNIGPAGWDSASGWGRLDVCGALNASGRACPTGAATATPTRTNTPVPPVATPTRTNTPVPAVNTPTRTPTNTPTRTPTNTPTSTPTNTPTRTPTRTPAATNTPCKGGSNKCGTPTFTPSPAFPAGCDDVNGDTWIDLTDVVLTMNHFGESGSDLPWDVNNDGSVDVADVTVLLGCIG